MREFFGGLLMAIGILIATLSGLCSAFFLFSMLTSSGGGEFGGGGMLILIAIVGGLPFMSGLGLFYWGRALVRSARARGE